MLDTFLDHGMKSPLAGADSATLNGQREGAVVLLGAAAKHLKAGDPRVSRALTTLCSSLNSPSEPVQQAVARVLPPLAKMEKETATNLLSEQLYAMANGAELADRRGGAFGVAGLVKGLGIGSLKS